MVQSLDIYNDCWEIFASYIKYVLRYITNENLTTISYHKNYIYNKMCNLHQEMFRIFQHKIWQKKIKAVLQISMFVHTFKKNIDSAEIIQYNVPACRVNAKPHMQKN